MPEDEKQSKIEDIKQHLYDREDTTTARYKEGVLHQIPHPIARSWNESDIKEKEIKVPSSSMFKKFFIATFIFFIAALGFAGYMFFKGAGSVSSDNIDIVVLGNAFTKGGEDLPLQIEIVNRNNASLELVNMTVEYPRGANDDSTDVVRLPRETIGTIAAGGQVTRNTKVVLYGEENTIRTVKVHLEYHPEGSNAIFTKDKDYPVTVSSAPLSMTIDAPDSVSADQIATFSITATLNTQIAGDSTILKAVYPPGFVFDSAVPAPILDNSVWSLSDLTQAQPAHIIIKGKLIGQDGDQKAFHFYAGTAKPSDKSSVDVVYNSLLHTMTIAKPFLEAKVLINGQDLETYTASGGEVVRGEIRWSNNLSTRVTDAQITANFSGNAFDKTTVTPASGFYDSANSQIIWDKNTVSQFSSIEPGATGSVGFSFKPLSLIGAAVSLKDPQVAIDVSIRGHQPAQGSTFADINNFAKKIIKIVSDFQLAASGTYVSGSLPPQAETETRYAIDWTLSNSANTVVNATATAVLPIYVQWVGVGQVGNENVSYNEVTREVVWNIGTVRPNTGFGINREISFIVALRPSTSQVGSIPQLTKDVFLTGTDSFTGTQVKSTRAGTTTKLTNDPAFKSGDERVIN